MGKINKLPKFTPGDDIYLSHKLTSNGMPDKLHVRSVFMMEDNKSWIYNVYVSSLGEMKQIREEYIMERLSKRKQACYSNQDIIYLCDQGYLYCGNMEFNKAIEFVNNIQDMPNISHIRLMQGITYDGKYTDPSLLIYGVWIKYNDDKYNKQEYKKQYIIK